MKPAVCYFRGSFLNPFEAQYLGHLVEDFNLKLGFTRSHRYNVHSIPIDKIEFACIDYMNGILPRRIGNRSVPNVMRLLGYEDAVLGLDGKLPGFDLVHVAEQSFYSSWQIAARKKKYGFKLLTVQDEVNPYWYLSKRAVVSRVEEVKRATDLFIARTERAKAALICEGVEASSIRVIGHGVDQARFRPGPRDANLCKKSGIEPDRFVVLFVGNLYWTKGIFSLANAVKLLFADRKIRELDPLFVMVGIGDERRRMEAVLERLGVRRSFLFLGLKPHEELPDLHRLADIFVLPSISSRYVLEQFGIVLIESMATGKPVVSTFCGSIDEVVGDCGVLVQPNDYFRLAEGLRRLCLDARLREELGERALERVSQRFSSVVIAQKIASAYREVLGS